MELIGAVGVFLLGSCVGLLLVLYRQGERRNQLAEHAAEQHAATLALAEQQRHEQRAQLLAMTTALVERMQLIGTALAAEVRDANTQQRNDRRLAMGLPRVSATGEGRPPRPSAERASSTPARSTPAAPATRRSTMHASPADAADEPTPPSGWTLEQVRAHTETAGEERPR